MFKVKRDFRGTWALGLWLGALCCQASAPSRAEVPKAGVPSSELEVLQRQYRLDETGCTRSAEEVVDIQRQCSKERWAACVFAGTMYSRSCGVAKDEVRAEELFRRACSFGSMLGCAGEGQVGHDDNRSVVVLEAPCSQGYAAACANLGVKLFNRGREADVPRALRLLEAACHEANQDVCSSYGKLVIKWQVEVKYADAQASLDSACKAQDLESCHVLAVAYEYGSLGSTDYARAATINSETCSLTNYPPSCNVLGYMYVLGHGVEKDPRQGATLFYNACYRGYGPGCYSMGEATEGGWGWPADPAKAVAFYDRGCGLGMVPACTRAFELRAATQPDAPAVPHQ